MSSVVVIDALGREVRLARPARRVVSLVPSETESVCALAGEAALVGCTDYCEEPPGIRDRVPSVGGTKKLDVDAVVALAPDLVLANREENGRASVQKLLDGDLPVHVSFPTEVSGALTYLASLAALLGIDPGAAPPIVCAREAFARHAGRSRTTPPRVFVPIWKEPWMTFDGRTFASDLLELCGARNVFSDRPRRYPLAADLGSAPAWSASRVGDRDTRYPRIALAEVQARRPDLILLPDEPYRFTEDDADALRSLAVPAANGGRIALCSGKDLFWFGTRLADSLDRVSSLVDRLASSVG